MKTFYVCSGFNFYSLTVSQTGPGVTDVKQFKFFICSSINHSPSNIQAMNQHMGVFKGI